MKKIVGFILSLAALMGALTLAQAANGGVIAAETGITENVSGLREKLDALWLKNNFSQERLDVMTQRWAVLYAKNFNAIPWESKQTLAQPGELKYDTAEEELAYKLDRNKPDMSEGLLATRMDFDLKYAAQYYQNGNFSYLFSGTDYWSVPDTETHSIHWYFTKDGEAAEAYQLSGITSAHLLQIRNPSMEFLKDAAGIEQLLKERNVVKVFDIKLFACAMLDYMYLRCDNGEYLIRLYNGIGGYFEEMKRHKIYTIDEAIALIEQETLAQSNNPYFVDSGLAWGITQTKPTYAAEGATLMAEGVIAGNEKGLDPLKPLTRLEAITILVNAFGYGDEPAAEASEFIDISNDSWGRKYANIAKAKGIDFLHNQIYVKI